MNQVCFAQLISLLQTNFAQTTAQKLLFCIDLVIFLYLPPIVLHTTKFLKCHQNVLANARARP